MSPSRRNERDGERGRRTWRGWTLLVIPDGGEGPVTQVTVTRRHLRNLTIGGVALTSLLIAVTGGLGLLSLRASGHDDLLEENLALRARLATIEREMDQVDDAVRRIRLYESRLKELSKGLKPASMGPLDEEDHDTWNRVWGTELDEESAGEPESGSGSAPAPTSAIDIRPAELWAQSVEARLARIIGLVEETEPRVTTVVQGLEDWRSARAAWPAFWPVGGALSSPFGYRRSPFNYQWKFHSGIDISADRGVTILCPSPGVVLFTGYSGGYGRLIEVDHGFGVRTRYAHCSAIFVQEGDVVEQGQPIGTVGTTGRTTGPHLHFELLINGRQVDPLDYLPPFHR